MFITSDMVYYLLERKFELSSKSLKCHNLLTTTRIFRGSCEARDCLYLLNAAEHHLPLSDSGFSFIVYGHTDTPVFSNIENNDVFFIDSPVDGYRVLEEIFDIFHGLLAWDTQLHELSSGKPSLEKLFRSGEELFQRPYLLIDRNLYVPVFTSYYKDKLESASPEDHSDILYKVPLSSSAMILSEPNIDQIFARKHLFLYPEVPGNQRFMCRNLMDDGQFIACLAIPLLPEESWPDSGFIQLFQHFFNFLQNVYLKYIGNTFTITQNNTLHKLLRSLLFSPKDPLPPDFDDILGGYYWEKNHHYRVVKLQFFSGTQNKLSTQYISQQLEKEWPKSCTLEAGGNIVWVINLSLSSNQLAKQDFHQTLAYLVQEHICKAGVSDTFEDLTALASHYRQANYALLLGQKTDPFLWYYHFENYLIHYFCEKASAEFSSEQLAHKGILTLWNHDKSNGTEYIKTLQFFCRHGFNVTKAADAMFVHRTTFIRRLERIREISDIDIENTDELLHMLLSFALLEWANTEKNKI